MMERSNGHHCSQDVLILSADWGKEARKRAVCAALQAPNWRIRRVKPPVEGWDLLELLKLGRYLRDRYDRSVIIGIDVVLGLPEAFIRKAGVSSFLEELSLLARTGCAPWVQPSSGGMRIRGGRAAVMALRSIKQSGA